MNRSFLRSLCTAVLVSSVVHVGASQRWTPAGGGRDVDPCGLPDTSASAYKIASLMNWGYGFDSLRADIVRWSASPYVHVDSVGASVQNRALYVLTIESPGLPAYPRKRIWIHARTHPNEVQGTWVTNQMIALLLGESPLARTLRDSCVFNVMPMYNPDGVELQYSRENAHGVDIESNWTAVPGEPEVQVLRAQFTRLTAPPNPILLALNMHSSVSCARYFVYHAEGGTSALYASLEQSLIGAVRRNFPGGIEQYTYFVSWTTSAPQYYPESWFWYNCRESVVALTYEDKNCAAAGGYDSTARAILQGAGEFLGVTVGVNSVVAGKEGPEGITVSQNYPNPFNPGTSIVFTLTRPLPVHLAVYDVLGREVSVLVNERKDAGVHRAGFEGAGLASGVYIYRLNAGGHVETRRMVLMR